MTDAPTETPESPKPDEKKPKGPGVGPSRILKRRWKRRTKILAAVVGLAVGALGGLAGRGQQQQPPALMDRTHGTPPPGPTPAGFGAHAPYAGYAGGDAPTIHTPQSPEG